MQVGPDPDPKNRLWPMTWPKCMANPAKACSPMPETPAGYKLVGQRLLYVGQGHVVEFQCEKDGYLAGDAQSASYICQKQEDGTFAFQPHSFTGTLPPCRAPGK